MSALSKLISLCPPQHRPIVVAILVICICLVLFRPRRKPVRAAGAASSEIPASASASTCAASSTTSRGAVHSISVVGTIIEYRAGRPQLLPEAATALQRIAAACDVYLVTQLPVDSDELEAATLDALRSGGVFGTPGCDVRKALFCSTEDGRGSIVRQLGPSTHLDTSPKILKYLAPHLTHVVYIDEACRPLEVPKGSLSVVKSLSEYASIYPEPRVQLS
uniref:Uncharacterized protein n=1 Tax=Haptolina brevifila TaxID=156173 RepID=A0A7S2N4E7_9EUKA